MSEFARDPSRSYVARHFHTLIGRRGDRVLDSHSALLALITPSFILVASRQGN